MQPMGFLKIAILTFPNGREVHYGVLLEDISPFHPFNLSLLVGLYLISRALLDSDLFPSSPCNSTPLARRSLPFP